MSFLRLLTVVVGILLASGAYSANKLTPAPIFEAALSNPHLIVARVKESKPVDHYGRSALVAIEQVLHGPLQANTTTLVAWEEFNNQQSRLATGDRVLLALDAMPSYSLWKKRFPQEQPLVIAAKGYAITKKPDTKTIQSLQNLFKRPMPLQQDLADIKALLQVSNLAQGNIALAAFEHLRTKKLPAKAEATLADDFKSLIRNEERPLPLRVNVFELIAEQRWQSFAPLAEQYRSPQANPLEVAARSCLATLKGGISEKELAALLIREQAPLRILALTHSKNTRYESRVESLVKSDPSPSRASRSCQINRGLVRRNRF